MPPTREAHTSYSVDDEDDDDIIPLVGGESDDAAIKYPMAVRLALFLCGVGVFARTETFLLQVQFFNVCLDYGVHYYAKANAALFLPGIAVLVLQSSIDHHLDKKYGTVRTNFVRVIVTSIGLLADSDPIRTHAQQSNYRWHHVVCATGGLLP